MIDEATFAQMNGEYGEFGFLSIEALIAAKKAVGRERDLNTVCLLLAIKERKEQEKNLF
jgi:hypothetical protein